MLESLCKCVDIMGINCFTTDQYQSLVTHLQDTMRTYVEKTKERINKRNEEDIDEETEDSWLEDSDSEENILSKVLLPYMGVL